MCRGCMWWLGRRGWEVFLFVLLKGSFLLFYVLATSKIISEWVLTCDSVHSRWLCSAAALGNQAASTMTWYPTQSRYTGINPTSPIPIMPSAWLGSDKYQFYKSLIWLDQGLDPWVWIPPPGRKTTTNKLNPPSSSKMGDGCSTHSVIQSGHHI